VRLPDLRPLIVSAVTLVAFALPLGVFVKETLPSTVPARAAAVVAPTRRAAMVPRLPAPHPSGWVIQGAADACHVSGRTVSVIGSTYATCRPTGRPERPVERAPAQRIREAATVALPRFL